MRTAFVPGARSTATRSSSEFALNVFKRRRGEPGVELYTIGVWEGTQQRAICHDACLECALNAIRYEMEKAGRAGDAHFALNTRRGYLIGKHRNQNHSQRHEPTGRRVLLALWRQICTSLLFRLQGLCDGSRRK